LAFRRRRSGRRQEKIDRKRGKYKDPIRQITDLAALRILVFYRDEVSRVEDVLKEAFEVDIKNTINKGAALTKNQFAYGGISYVVELPKDQVQQPEYAEFRDLKFEIQILTLCQYAWAEIQRKIEYKTEELVPFVVSRRLSRLMALFDLADDEFMQIRNEEIEALRQCKISSLSSKKFLRISSKMRNLLKDAYKECFTEMDPYDDQRYLVELLEVCSILKFENIASLELYLSSETNLSKLMYSLRKHGKPMIRAGPISMCLILIYHSSAIFSSSFLSGKGWAEPMLTILSDRS
jgi:ppGpp synthetase/RelA/SpoT-type nucleotidyltranferase